MCGSDGVSGEFHVKPSYLLYHNLPFMVDVLSEWLEEQEPRYFLGNRTHLNDLQIVLQT